MRKKIGIFFVTVIIAIGIGFIWYSKSNNAGYTSNKENVSNNSGDSSEKKNYDFNGKNIVCDDFISDGDNAMYINNGDIYYISYKDEMFISHKIVSRGLGVGKELDNLVGYVNSDSVIDYNYASLVDGKDYVIYILSDSDENDDSSDENDIFDLDDINSDNFYRGSGYAGASNKAVYLKNGVAYYLVYDGDNLVSSDVIATGVKRIGNLGDDKSKIIVVYIESDTVISDNYSDYDIILDDNGDKCIKIC